MAKININETCTEKLQNKIYCVYIHVHSMIRWFRPEFLRDQISYNACAWSHPNACEAIDIIYRLICINN